MISVVIPTMWKFTPFPDFLSDVADSAMVKEIIIINNDVPSTPQHTVFDHPKVSILDLGQNIFVNPSWNLGAMYCNSDIICLANDDVIYDLRIFNKISEHVSNTSGCYGISSRMNIDGDIEFIPALGHDLFGFGQLMFIPKNKWIDIPSELNVWYGDNFIFDLMVKNNYINYIIKNLLFYTPHAQTSQHANPDMIQQEIQDWPTVCNSYMMTSYHP